MKYKILKAVELDSKIDSLIDVSALCMLDLLYDRLIDDGAPAILKDDNLSIDYDFSLYDGVEKIKEEMGYTNDKFISSADSFIRRL